jgi:transmembrane 9 superfamily protein 2/4
LIFLSSAFGFYVPGVAPVEFTKGDSISVRAVKMTSARTQLPYRYESLPFCEPKQKEFIPENLGEFCF